MLQTSILREYFSYAQLVYVRLAGVAEVLGRFDLLVVVKPYYVEPLRAHDPVLGMRKL